jgi:hypothetical protein
VDSPIVADPPEQLHADPSLPIYKRINGEVVAKNLALFGLSCYIIGLLSVNMYLFSLGFSDFTPINPRFIATGCLVFAILAINVSLPLMGIWFFLYKRTKPKKRKPIVWKYRILNIISKIMRVFLSTDLERALGALALVLAPILIFVIFLIANDTTFDPNIILYWVVTNMAVILYTTGLIFSSNNKETDTKKSSFYRIGNMLNEWFILAISCLAYVVLFTSFIYPVIPEQFGGGQPKQVTILFDPAAIDGIRELGVPIPQTTQLSEPVTLLFESSDRYILRLQNKQVVGIDKKLVQGVRVESN